MSSSPSLYRFIRDSIYPYRWLLFLQSCNVLVWAGLRFMGSYARASLTKIQPGHMEEGSAATFIVSLLWLIMGISLAWNLSYRLHDLVWRQVYPGVKKSLIAGLMDHLMHHAQGFYQQHPTGRLSNRVREIANKVPTALEWFTDGLLSTICTLTVSIASLWIFVSPLFAMIWIGWVCCFLLSAWWMYPYLYNLNEEASEGNNQVMGYVSDVLSNLMSVRLFSGIPKEKHLLEGRLDTIVKAEKKRDMVTLIFYGVTGLLFNGVLGLCLWLSIGKFQAYPNYAEKLVFLLENSFGILLALWPFVETVKTLLESWAYIRKGAEVILSTPEIADRPDARALTFTKGAISYEKVQFAYQTDTPLFDDLTVHIPGGQQVALLGYSGSGKTTFINLLLRIFDARSGHIRIDGQDIRDVTQASLRQHMSVVAQDSYLFDRSVLDNIRYSRPEASMEEVIEAAKRAYAHDFIEELPQGYHTLLGERGASLSGGQRQRIAIARAFLRFPTVSGEAGPVPVSDAEAPIRQDPYPTLGFPSIMILDEATSQLDPNTDHLIQTSLEDLRRLNNQTTLIITHRPTTLLQVDRILVFDQGKLAQDGDHHTLLAADGPYRQFWYKEQPVA